MPTNKTTNKRKTEQDADDEPVAEEETDDYDQLKCPRIISDTGDAYRVVMLGRTRDALFPGKGTESPPNGAHSPAFDPNAPPTLALEEQRRPAYSPTSPRAIPRALP